MPVKGNVRSGTAAPSRVVVVGAGHAGFMLAMSLRAAGFAGQVLLVDAQQALPYQRPPLSKAFLLGKATAQELWFRPASFYRDKQIDLVLGEPVIAIDRRRGAVLLASGKCLEYDHLVLATGASERPLAVPGAGLAGVVSLRTAGDTAALRGHLGGARSLVVIGGGFIGLEVASAAAELGVATTVIEMLPRVMARLVSGPVSAVIAVAHAAHGVRVLTGSAVNRIIGKEGRAVAVETAGGACYPADVVVAGIGVRPSVEPARKAGLRVSDGIEVDRRLRTSDERISAIGDCALFPRPDGMARLECVQNATDQARHVAAQLTGRQSPYDAVPWFWTDQAALKLQVAGVPSGADEAVIRGDQAEGRFSLLSFRNGCLHAAESVNCPSDNAAVRRLLSCAAPLSPAQAADPSFDLVGYARLARATAPRLSGAR